MIPMTTLSRTPNALKTVELCNGLNDDEGVLVTYWATMEHGQRSRSIALNPAELQALLHSLSPSLLVEVLGEQGILCTMGGEAPDVAAGLDALVAEQDAPNQP